MSASCSLSATIRRVFEEFISCGTGLPYQSGLRCRAFLAAALTSRRRTECARPEVSLSADKSGAQEIQAARVQLDDWRLALSKQAKNIRQIVALPVLDQVRILGDAGDLLCPLDGIAQDAN